MAPRKIVKARKQIVWENAKSGEPPSAKHTSLKYFAEQEKKGGNETVKTWKDLTNFNWGTEKETDVNMFLHDKVGCKHLAKDGINFIFWGDEKQDRECELHKIKEKGGTGFIWIPEQYSEEYNTNSMNTITVKTPEPAKIISVEFLDGTDILKTTKEQYVNLPALGKWVDKKNNIENIDRLSAKPRIKVEFDKPGSHPFTIKLVPDGNNSKYSDNEQVRNPKFKYVTEKKTYTQSNGIAIINDMNVAMAGKDIYSLTASDNDGNVVNSSGKIRTTRLVYFVEIRMKDFNSLIQYNLATFVSEFDSSYIIMEKLMPNLEMDYIKNINPAISAENSAFKTKAIATFKASAIFKKSPFCIAAVYTDHLAVKLNNHLVKEENVPAGPGTTPYRIHLTGPISSGSISSAVEPKYLWHNIVTGEGWFNFCTFTYNDTRDKSLHIVRIDSSNVRPVLTEIPDKYDTVEIDLTALPHSNGTIRLRVNCVDNMKAGLSFGGTNLIVISTRWYWRDVDEYYINQCLIHEMGHKVGMVADAVGTKPSILPDKVITFYDKSDAPTHWGPHCFYGIPPANKPYDLPANYNNVECVMYGKLKKGKTAFCANNCKPATLKLDISDGWL